MLPRGTWFFFSSCLLLVTGSCLHSSSRSQAPNEKTEILVFAAASLTQPFAEIGHEFTSRHPDITVRFNFAGSQQLAQQISQGAPCDVFASANARQMDAAVASGRIDPSAVGTFARNRLVVVVPRDDRAKLATLADLAKPSLKIVLAAREVPVGQYSIDMLDKIERSGRLPLGFKARVLANTVSYEQDVKAVLAKVVLGEADAGVVYTSDIAASSADRVTRIDVPDDVNVIAEYPIAALGSGPHTDAAAAFVAHVRSTAGQTILAKYGFAPATPAR